MVLDRVTLHSLAKMSDEIGVLSIYANADPLEDSTQQPAWHKRVRKELAALKDRLEADGSRERRLAVIKRLNALDGDLEWLLDRSEPGQGRALFAAVCDAEVRRVALQVPLVDRVFLQPGAYLRPLVDAWSAHGPAGVLAVSAEQVRIVELGFGLTEEIAVFPYEPTVDSRELKGPAASNPAMAQRSASQHDLFVRRETDRLTRHLRAIGPDVAQFAADRGWEYVAVTGDAVLTNAVVDGLPAGFRPDLVRLDHPVNTVPPPKIATLVAPAMERARQQRLGGLAQRVRDQAMSGSAGACGLAPTLDALQEHRVAHLLLAADGQWQGRRGPDGLLRPDTDETSAFDLEPFLGERMIELAFGEGAEVTILAPATAAPLGDGVGAILRW